MHPTTRPLCLALLLLGAACKSPPSRGEHHAWLAAPAALPEARRTFAVEVTPTEDPTAPLLAAHLREVLANRGYEIAADAAQTATALRCGIVFQGSPDRAPPSEPLEALLRRFSARARPSCIVLLRVATDAEPDARSGEVALWTDSGSDTPVLTRTGPVRRTTGALAEPPDGPTDGRHMLDPTIALGAGEAIASLFPPLDG